MLVAIVVKKKDEKILKFVFWVIYNFEASIGCLTYHFCKTMPNSLSQNGYFAYEAAIDGGFLMQILLELSQILWLDTEAKPGLKLRSCEWKTLFNPTIGQPNNWLTKLGWRVWTTKFFDVFLISITYNVLSRYIPAEIMYPALSGGTTLGAKTLERRQNLEFRIC